MNTDMNIDMNTDMNIDMNTGGNIPVKATVGPDFKRKELKVGNVEVTLQIWDTAGQEQYQALGFSYYRGANCCVLVFDLSDRKTFESLSMWRK